MLRRRELAAVAAVSPIIEIGECVQALERPGNVLYQWNFVKDLKRRMRRKDRFWPGRFDSDACSAASRRSASSTRPTRRRTSASTAPTTTTTAPARCGSSIASACRRWSSRPRTIRSCLAGPFRDPKVSGNPVHRARRLRARRALRLRRTGVRRRRRLLGGESDRRVRGGSYFQPVGLRVNRAGSAGLRSGSASGSPDATLISRSSSSSFGRPSS